ncbi:MAG: glycosyltransferase [Phycisphaeraceae bacterium]
MNHLTACFIVKDDADNLARAIRSVQTVADTLLVTDTGSSDNSIETAQALGASVDHFPWIDDFAAAYTHVVQRTTTDWILLLDSDEFLLPDQDDVILHALNNPAAMGYMLRRQDLTDLSQPDRFTEMWQLRLFRNHPDLRYTGRIHHHLDPPLETLGEPDNRRVLESDISFRHTGYANRDWPAKNPPRCPPHAARTRRTPRPVLLPRRARPLPSQARQPRRLHPPDPSRPASP